MESSGCAGGIRTDVCLGCCCCVMLSPVQLFMTLWTVARQALLSMGFSRQEYWRGLPFPSPREFPNPGIKPTSLVSPALPTGLFTIMLESPHLGWAKLLMVSGTFAAVGVSAFTPLWSCFRQFSTACCPHISLILQGKAVLTPRGGPCHVFTAQHPGLSDWRVSQGSIC